MNLKESISWGDQFKIQVAWNKLFPDHRPDKRNNYSTDPPIFAGREEGQWHTREEMEERLKIHQYRNKYA